MPKLRLFLSLLALAVLVVLIGFWVQAQAQTPSSLLASARERLERAYPDFDGALRELDRGIRFAQREGDTSVERALQLERARLLFDRGDPVLASAACEEVLQRLAPSDGPALSLGSRAALLAGDPELAVARARTLTRVLPFESAGPLLLGDATMELSRRALGDLASALENAQPRSTAQHTLSAAARAASLPGSHPGRQRMEEELERALPEDVRDAGMASFALSSGYVARAGRAYLSSIELAPDGRAVSGCQTILERAGKVQASADLGLFALRRSDLSSGALVTIQTGFALSSLGRDRSFRELLKNSAKMISAVELSAARPDREQLLAWCELLYRSECWRELLDASNVLRGIDLEAATVAGEEAPVLPDFFRSVALLHVEGGNVQLAESLLARALSADDAETLGYASYMWMTAAEAARGRGNRLEERNALVRARGAFPFPEDERTRELAGRCWARLGEMALEDRDGRLAETCFAHALARLPGEREELEKRWEEAGLLHLEIQRRSAQALAANPDARDLRGLFPKMGSYEACLRARAKVEGGSWRDLSFLLRPVLEDHPGMPVALELLSRGELARGNAGTAIDAAIELGERGFTTRSLLQGIPPESFTQPQLLRALLCEPRALAIACAESLARSGRTSDAKRVLEREEPSKLVPSEVARAARIFCEIGRPETALEWIRSIPAEDPSRAPAVLAAVEASLRSKEGALLEQALRSALGTPDLHGAPGFLHAIDLLLAVDEIAAAQALLARSEERVRSSGLLLQQALLQSIQGRGHLADETLDRCEPFFDGGETELGRLARAADENQPSEIALAAAGLLGTPLAEDAFRRAIFTALSGDVEAAVALLDEVEDGPSELLVPFTRRMLARLSESSPLVSDGPSRALQPDRGLVLLACLEAHPWSLWALARLRDLPEDLRATPEKALFEAVALLSLNEHERADACLLRILPSGDASTGAPDPTVAAAWILRERIAEEAFRALPLERAQRAYERLLALRLARIEAVGPRGMSLSEVALARAFDHSRLGEEDQARSLIERALARAPRDFELTWKLARLAERAGESSRSVELYRGLLEREPPERTRALIPEVLASLRSAREAGGLPTRAYLLELETLAARFDDDPSVAREFAEELVRQEKTAGTAEALEHLEHFRERHPATSIEALRSGEAELWGAFLAKVDPEEAARFARSELERAPFSFALWRAWSDALVAAGRREEAFEVLEKILLLTDDPSLEARHALLASELEHSASTTPRETGAEDEGFLLARTLFELLQPELRRRALARAELLWANRAQSGIPLEPFAHRYALAAFEEGDLALGRSVLREAIEETTAPLDQAVLQAFLALSTEVSRAPAD